MEAYSVAIRLKLIDSVSGGLLGLVSHFSALNKHISGTQAGMLELEKSIGRLKVMGLFGGAALAVGGGMLAMLDGPIKAAREYELAFSKFKTLNLGDSVNRQADQFARSANIMGVSAKQLMTTMSESVGIFGSFSEAQKFAPKLAGLNAANSLLFHGKVGEIDEGSTRALAKFMDRRGLTKDEAGFDKGLDLAERLVTGSGGFIQFKDLANFSQMGGTAFRSISDTGLTNMALLLQEQGGARAGTAMMSIYQNLVAGRTPVKTMHELENFGLGTIHQHSNGTVGGRKSTSNTFELNPAYSAVLQADPVEFFRSIFLPALARNGITSEAGILKATNDLLSNRNASGQASIMTTQLVQIARDAALTKNAQGTGQVLATAANDPSMRAGNLHAKYQNLLVEIGEAALPIVTKVITHLTSFVTSITAFARANPGTVKLMVEGFMGLAGLMIAGGAITLITAGFKALSLVLTLGGKGGLGGMLVDAAGGLGAFVSKLGKLGVLGAVGAAAYKATDYVANDLFHLDEKLGAFFSGQNSYNPNANPYVRPNKGNGQTVVLSANAKKLGFEITPHVTQQQSVVFKRPQTGASTFDGLMNPALAGGF